MTKSLRKAIGWPPDEKIIKVSIQKDNAGDLLLLNTLPPQLTPHSKYYASKRIWFHENIQNHGIKNMKIDTVEKLGYMFTKGLKIVTFGNLRKNIIGY